MTFWAEALLTASLQGCLLIPIVWIVTRLCRQLPAVAVVWLWRLALLKVVAAFVFPIPVYVAGSGASETATAPSTVVWVAALSLAGALVVLGDVLLQFIALRRLVRSGTPYEGENLFEKRRGSGSFPISGPSGDAEGSPCQVAVLVSELADRPMVVRKPGSGIAGWGAGHCIILPQSMLGEPIEVLRMVVAHEMGHVRYRDLFWNWVMLVPQALLFFHPLVRLAGHELRQAQETACDELARRATGASVREYGQMLIRVAVKSSALTPHGAASVASDYRSLKSRLERLDMSHRTNRALAAGFLLLCLLALPAWKLVERAPEAPVRTRIAGSSLEGGFAVAEPVSPARKLGRRVPVGPKEGS